MRDYYPKLMSAVILHEVPFILQYIFKLIKSWLPEHDQVVLHLTTKKDITNYVAKDQLPDFMDGDNPLSYRTLPENSVPFRDLAPSWGLPQTNCEKFYKHLVPYFDNKY